MKHLLIVVIQLMMMMQKSVTVTGMIMGDIGEGWHYIVRGLKMADIEPTRMPRQIIGSSVVTSVTIVESRNYVVTRDETNKVPVPKKPDKTPRFEFYLYNDSGRIIKQYLTIHEIQQILLQQSQNLGLKQLGWLIGRNETDWTSSSSEKKSSKTTVSKTSSKTTSVSTAGTTPGSVTTADKTQLLGVIDMVQGIVASAQDGDEDKEDNVKKNTSNKRRKKPNKNKNNNRNKTTTRKSKTTTLRTTKSTKSPSTTTKSTTTTVTTTTSTRRTTTRKASTTTTTEATTTTTTTTRKASTTTTTTNTTTTTTTATTTTTTRTTTTTTTATTTTTTPTTTTTTTTTTTITTTTTTTPTTTTTTTTTTTYDDFFEINLLNDIRPWTYQDSDSGVIISKNKAGLSDDKDPDFEDFLSSLKPQSPFASNKNKEETVKATTTSTTSTTTSSTTTTTKVVVTTKRSTVNILDGFVIGNPVGLLRATTTTTTKSSKKPDNVIDSTLSASWSWTDSFSDASTVNKQTEDIFASESDENSAVSSYKTNETDGDQTDDTDDGDRDPTTSTTTKRTTTSRTTQETTTNFSSYLDFLNDLIAKNTRSSPKPSTTSRPTTNPSLFTAAAEIELTIDGINEDNDHEHDHDHEHHDEHHFEELAQSKKSIPRAPTGNLGLSVTNSGLDTAARNFVNINNDVGIKLYKKLVQNNPEDNIVFCPVAANSALAMIFLGARGSTSWEINELLELDKMITFNPHLLYKNISDTLSVNSNNYKALSSKNILISKDVESIIDFYKMRISYFYGAKVETVDFDNIKQEILERMNNDIELVSQENEGKLNSDSPLSITNGNYLQGKFSDPGVESTLEFINLPRARRLIPVPSLSWSGTFNAGYDDDLDATAVELPYKGGDLSLILMLPGKISEFVTGGLSRLENSLDQKSLDGLMKSFVSHQLELKVPSLSANSVLNLNESFSSLGLENTFSENADFSGINGGKSLRISSFIQANKFEFEQNSRVKREVVQARVQKVDRIISMLTRRNRQNQIYQLSFERQFLYIVRHNPTGLIIYIGRYFQPDQHDHEHHQHQRR